MELEMALHCWVSVLPPVCLMPPLINSHPRAEKIPRSPRHPGTSLQGQYSSFPTCFGFLKRAGGHPIDCRCTDCCQSGSGGTRRGLVLAQLSLGPVMLKVRTKVQNIFSPKHKGIWDAVWMEAVPVLVITV